MYKITLADGTMLKNLELNGNNYIAEGVIDDAVFKDNLATVTITDGKTTETYEDMVLLSHRVDGGAPGLFWVRNLRRKRQWSVSTLCCPLLLTVSRTFSWHLPKSTK